MRFFRPSLALAFLVSFSGCSDDAENDTPDILDGSAADGNGEVGTTDSGSKDGASSDGALDTSILDSSSDATPPGDAPASTNRKVFAHYMVAIRTYGSSVEAYKHEINDARAAGIDGFALNEGSWRGGNYQVDTALIFQAAKELDVGFSLFFSFDMSGDLTSADILDMVNAYESHTAYLHKGSRPVLSTYSGESGGAVKALPFWRDEVLAPLRAKGLNPFFVPGFAVADYGLVTQPKLEADYAAWWKEIIDGYFFFGAAGQPNAGDPSLILQSQAAAAVMHAHDLVFMAPVSPQYWGGKQPTVGRRYFEFDGGEGIETQWRSIIDVQKADWVELVTWNDFGEGSYFSPVDDVSKYWPYEYVTTLGFFKTHAGETALAHYFIDWYKNDKAPAIAKDQLFYFYRTHPDKAVATGDTHDPVTVRYGTVTDEIFVTTLLTAAGELRVTTGGTTTKISVPAGLKHSRVPFKAGDQTFELYRGTTSVLKTTGEPIVEKPVLYDYNYTTGSVGSP